MLIVMINMCYDNVYNIILPVFNKYLNFNHVLVSLIYLCPSLFPEK